MFASRNSYCERKNWGVQLKDSHIYEILHCLGLSHQRGHRDYANADATAQQQWTQKIKKTAIAASKRENCVL